jgi:hypothetical protein
MMILGSLRDIADEVRTLRQELRRLECAAAR